MALLMLFVCELAYTRQQTRTFTYVAIYSDPTVQSYSVHALSVGAVAAAYRSAFVLNAVLAMHHFTGSGTAPDFVLRFALPLAMGLAFLGGGCGCGTRLCAVFGTRGLHVHGFATRNCGSGLGGASVEAEQELWKDDALLVPTGAYEARHSCNASAVHAASSLQENA